MHTNINQNPDKYNLDTTSLSININLFRMKTMISINVHFCLKKYFDVSSRREQQENLDLVIVGEAPSLPLHVDYMSLFYVLICQ